MKNTLESLENFELIIYQDGRVPVRQQAVPTVNPSFEETSDYLIFKPGQQVYEKDILLEQRGDQRPLPQTHTADFFILNPSRDTTGKISDQINSNNSPKREAKQVNPSRFDPISSPGAVVVSRIVRVKQQPSAEQSGSKIHEKGIQALTIMPEAVMDPTAKTYITEYFRGIPREEREQALEQLGNQIPILSFSPNKEFAVLNGFGEFLNATPDSHCIDVLAYGNLRFMRDNEEIIEDKDKEDDNPQPKRDQLDALFGLNDYEVVFEFLQTHQLGDKTLRLRTGIAMQDLDFENINFQMRRMMRRSQIPTDRISKFVKPYLYVDLAGEKPKEKETV